MALACNTGGLSRGEPAGILWQRRDSEAMNTFTLLHVANAGARVTTVDPWILTPAVIGFMAALAFLWAPALPVRVMPRRRVRRRIGGITVAVVVFLAVLP